MIQMVLSAKGEAFFEIYKTYSFKSPRIPINLLDFYATLPTFVSLKMRRANNIVDFKHSVGIVLGAVTALIITLSQSLYYLPSTTTELEDVASTEQTDDGNDVSVSAQNDLLSSGGQLSLSHVWHFNIIIPFDDFRDFTSTCLKAVDYNTQFRTLFRTLISPNAP